MPRAKKSAAGREQTYALGAVARLTGLSPDVLRAWEKRYGVVRPLRTTGGTRRYRESDVRRLRLLASATRAGHSIGGLAKLSDQDLARLVTESQAAPISARDEALEALACLDPARAEQIASLQLSALGPARFAREFALPLLQGIGSAWESGRLCIASEHLGSATLRSLLGASLRPTRASVQAVPILFTTPPGERHELGLLSAALTALGAGGNPVYLGPDLPVEEVLRAAELAEAGAVALSVITLSGREAERVIRAIRGGLPESIQLWAGGARAAELKLPGGCEYLESLDDLEQKVMLLPAAG